MALIRFRRQPLEKATQILQDSFINPDKVRNINIFAESDKAFEEAVIGVDMTELLNSGDNAKSLYTDEEFKAARTFVLIHRANIAAMDRINKTRKFDKFQEYFFQELDKYNIEYI